MTDPYDCYARRGLPVIPFDVDLCWEIVDKVALGEPLAPLLRSNPDRYPAKETFNGWRRKHEWLDKAMLEARTDGFDEIAYRLRETVRGRGESTGDVQRDRLIADVDLKILPKWHPTKYGDKVTLAGDPEAPLRGMSDAELDAAIEAKLAALQEAK